MATQRETQAQESRLISGSNCWNSRQPILWSSFDLLQSNTYFLPKEPIPQRKQTELLSRILASKSSINDCSRMVKFCPAKSWTMQNPDNFTGNFRARNHHQNCWCPGATGANDNIWPEILASSLAAFLLELTHSLHWESVWENVALTFANSLLRNISSSSKERLYQWGELWLQVWENQLNLSLYTTMTQAGRRLEGKERTQETQMNTNYAEWCLMQWQTTNRKHGNESWCREFLCRLHGRTQTKQQFRWALASPTTCPRHALNINTENNRKTSILPCCGTINQDASFSSTVNFKG